MAMERDLSIETPDSSGGRPLALVLGRHEDTRSMMRAMLEAWGFEVEELVTSDGVASKVADTPSLVMMDASLPFQESLDTATELKSCPKLRDVPILMMSGFAQADYRDAAVERGITDYLVKPVDFDALQKFVVELARLNDRKGGAIV